VANGEGVDRLYLVVKSREVVNGLKRAYIKIIINLLSKMNESLFSLFLAVLPVFIITIYLVIKNDYSIIQSKFLIYFLLVFSLIIILSLMVIFALSTAKLEAKTFKPDNASLIFLIIILLAGIMNILQRKRYFKKIDFLSYFLVIYSSLVIIWKIVSISV